jgi:hypothetical protein
MKLCNFKSTTTNDYIHKAASLLRRLSCPSDRKTCLATPSRLKPAPGAPTDPHQEANRFPYGIPTSPVA